MERLYEVHVLSAQELEDVSGQTGADIGLGNQDAHVLVEPLRVETGPAAGRAEGGLVYVVVHIAVYVVLLGQFFDAQGGLYAANELVVVHVLHHLVFGGELVGIGLYLFLGEVFNLRSVVAVGEVMDFRAYLGKEVVVVEVGAPHGLVHVGHEAHGRLPEDAAGAGGIGINPHFLRYLLPGAHHGAHVLAGNAFEAAGSFQGAHQRAGAEVIHKVILVQGGFKAHPVFGHVAEEDGHVRAVAQETDPCEILAPGEEFRIDKVHFLVEKEVQGFPGVLPFIDDARIHQIQEVHAGFDVFHHFELALVIGPAFGTVQVLEAGRCNEQQTRLGFPEFIFCFHYRLLILVWSRL